MKKTPPARYHVRLAGWAGIIFQGFLLAEAGGQTWYYRYKDYGVTAMNNHSRADKGRTRKVTPEEVLEAINSSFPQFHQKKRPNKSAIYRFCIEKGLLHADQIALTTFCRFVREYELLKEDVSENKRRLAFSMQYANQLWQADTMFGPPVSGAHGQKRQAKLIAFIDDAIPIFVLLLKTELLGTLRPSELLVPREVPQQGVLRADMDRILGFELQVLGLSPDNGSDSILLLRRSG
jgi:hypothetical protein